MKDTIINLFLAVGISLSILSCSSSPKTNPICYDIKSLRSSIEQFNFQEQIVYIPLETKADCPIGGILKIILTSDYIFIHTRNLLYQFDLSGKYIRKIGSKGRGPGEYLNIADLAIDESSGKIFIYDLQGINIFNLSGEYLGKEIHNGMWKRFEVIDNMYVISPLNLSGNEPCMIKIVAKNDSVTCFKNNVLYEQQNLFLVFDIKNFQKLNNELIFHQQFNDTIYRVDPNNATLSISYYFGFGNFKLPFDLLGSSDRFNDESQNYGYLYDVCENNNNVFATIFYKGEYEKYVINKKTSKSFTVAKGQSLIWPQWSDERGTLISYLQATDLINHKNEISDSKLKNIVSKLNEEDNPIIVLIK